MDQAHVQSTRYLGDPHKPNRPLCGLNGMSHANESAADIATIVIPRIESLG
jgi:hypothetical protein